MIPGAGRVARRVVDEQRPAFGQREQDERDGRDPDAPFDVMTAFFHDVPQEIVEEAFARGEPRQSDTPFDEPWPLDRWPDVPTSVIAGRRDRLFPVEFMRGLARERLGVRPGRDRQRPPARPGAARRADGAPRGSCLPSR